MPELLDIALGQDSHRYKWVNKFGATTDADSGNDTDVWDGATGASPTWTAPTQARTHDIASTDLNDTSAGSGARTIRIYGLTSWSTDEVFEDITMNGTSNVASSNSYVIIHRMKVMTCGASGPNVGTITATAQTDSTVTAQIGAGNGQTLMAIYGVPSTKIAWIARYYGSIIKASSAMNSSLDLRVNPFPDSQLAPYLIKHTVGLDSAGSSYIAHRWEPVNNLGRGPMIIKIVVNSSANNATLKAGFDIILTR